MAAKLYAVPASHPCAAVAGALELKGIDYKRIDLVLVFHKLHQKLRFGGGTVPGIIFDDGRKVLGSRAILAALDEMRPDPPLYPADAETRQRVEEADQWGDEVLQPLVRRIIWLALSRDTAAQLSYLEGANLVPPVPAPMARLSGGAISWAERKINSSTEPAVRADLAALPRHLDRVDGWLRDGTLGQDPPTAADLQIGSALRLLTTLEDLSPLFERHPAGEYAHRVFPHYPGRTPAGTFPQEWLPKVPTGAVGRTH